VFGEARLQGPGLWASMCAVWPEATFSTTTSSLVGGWPSFRIINRWMYSKKGHYRMIPLLSPRKDEHFRQGKDLFKCTQMRSGENTSISVWYPEHYSKISSPAIQNLHSFIKQGADGSLLIFIVRKSCLTNIDKCRPRGLLELPGTCTTRSVLKYSPIIELANSLEALTNSGANFCPCSNLKNQSIIFLTFN